MTRVRGFTQDDAHLFCTPDQLDQEFKNVIDLVLYVFGSLGFENFTAQVSVRDLSNLDKYIGSVENWEKAENATNSKVTTKARDFFIKGNRLKINYRQPTKAQHEIKNITITDKNIT